MTVTDVHVPTFSVDVKCKGIAEAGVVPQAVPCFKSGEPWLGVFFSVCRLKSKGIYQEIEEK